MPPRLFLLLLLLPAASAPASHLAPAPARRSLGRSVKWQQDAFWISFWVGPQVGLAELDKRVAELAECNFTGYLGFNGGGKASPYAPDAARVASIKTDDTATPVSKSVGWFVGSINDLNSDGASAFLSSSNLTDRILPCCNSLSILPNGSLGPSHYGNMSRALYGETEVLVNLGGTAAVVSKIAARKEAFAQEVLQMANAMDVSGFTMDWEFGAVMN